MDIASHGLWGAVAFGRKNKKAFWTAFFFGVAPDLFSFGIFFFHRILTSDFSIGTRRPSIESIPDYVYTSYNITHSLVTFAIVFLIVWFIRKKPLYLMLGWPLHIVMDIFTHSTEFFPTPFAWPLLDYRFNGISWGHPLIFFPNVILLVIVYIWFYVRKRKQVE
jgi:hypothetical protein